MDQRKQRQRETIMNECRRRGVVVEERGECYLLHGPGVDLAVADLANLDMQDIEPYMPRKQSA
jgi:hypothetical protein